MPSTLKERIQEPCSVSQTRIAGKIQFTSSQKMFISVAKFYDDKHNVSVRKAYLKTCCNCDLLFCFSII